MVSLQSSVLCIHVLGTSSFVKADGMFSLLYYFPFHMSAKFVSGNNQCIQMCNIHTILLFHLLTSSVQSLQGNLRLRPWCIDWAIKSQVWDFPVMTEWTRLISYYMAFSLWTWACNQLKPTTGQQITLKNLSPQWVVHLPRDTVRWHWSADTLFDSF